ncbi:MAG: hypothetical protein C0622_05155 [Desulfuromonas sp.]|nr:MAG: hypothetical protein C0622_05155 [Desulfuromonas sp.]
MKILFLHGLESGPHGSKYQALKAMFGDILAPDCSGVSDPWQRLEIIQKAIAEEEGPFLVVGSSMGGLMAMLLHQANPGPIAGMVLCAPALHRRETPAFDYADLPPTRVIHGSFDDVVPPASSLRFGARLTLVDDDHRLANSMDIILREVFELKLSLLPAM